VTVIIEHPVWLPQSVIVARNPSAAAAASDHVSRITKFEDFGEVTVKDVTAPAAT
jgi:hypothetical protein